MNPFAELIPDDAIVLTPRTDVDGTAYAVTYPDAETGMVYYNRQTIAGEGVPLFLELANRYGDTVVIVPLEAGV